MKFTQRLIYVFSALFLFSSFFSVNVFAEESLLSITDSTVFGQGLLPTPDEYINQIAVNHTRESRNVQLPSRFDISTSPYFPPIGNQLYQGSCAAFATTYYGFTYYKNKLNKTDASLIENQCSPTWTFNFLAQDISTGISFGNALFFLKNHGSVSMETLPYNWMDCAALPSNEDARDALKIRISDYNTFPINTASSSAQTQPNFECIKQMLSQGELFYIGFVCETNGNNCDSVTLPNGEKLIYQVNNASDGHAGTVVGYDDNISFDINGDEIIDDAEKGAFKVVNSWGTSSSFSPGGYYWVLYDALNINSQIPGDCTKSTTRTAAFSPSNSGSNNVFWWFTVSEYKPFLIAKATVNTSRNHYSELLAIQSNIQPTVFTYTSHYTTSATRTLNTTVFLDYTDIFSNMYSSSLLNITNYNIGKKWLLDLGDDAIYSDVEMVDSNGNVITSFADELSLDYAKSCIVNCPIGDVNYDGELTQADATLILRFLNSTPYSYFQKHLADFNQDGVINSADPRELLQTIE